MRALYTAIAAVLALALAAAGCWQLYVKCGIWWLLGYIALCAAFFPFASYLHEGGHKLFGSFVGMKVEVERGNPFAPSSSIVIPKNSRNVVSKLVVTSVGGPAVNLLFAAVGAAFLAGGEVLNLLSFIAPSSLYLFALNAFPAAYAGGKTDMLVITEAASRRPCSLVLERVLYVQGLLAEGTPLSDIDEELLFSVPQIPDDEPAFAMLVSLRAEYYSAVGDQPNAQKWRDRLETL